MYSNITRDSASRPYFIAALGDTISVILKVNATVSEYSAASNARKLLSDAIVSYDVVTSSGLSSVSVGDRIEESVISGEFLRLLNSRSGSYITKVSSVGSQAEVTPSQSTPPPTSPPATPFMKEQTVITTNLYNPGKFSSFHYPVIRFKCNFNSCLINQ